MTDRRTLWNVEVDVLVDGHGFKAVAIERGEEDFFLAFLREAAAEIRLEFLDQQRQAFRTAAAMTQGILDCLFKYGSVNQLDAESIGDGALVGGRGSRQ